MLKLKLGRTFDKGNIELLVDENGIVLGRRSVDNNWPIDELDTTWITSFSPERVIGYVCKRDYSNVPTINYHPIILIGTQVEKESRKVVLIDENFEY